jgi:23S rRNA (uracil1939-C5)-methyltransferase
MPDRIGDVDLLVSMRSFLQVNHEVAALLARQIADRTMELVAGEHEPGIVIDLYAGVGVIASHLARQGLQVVAVERVASAVADAEAIRIRSDDATRIRFVAASAERFLREPAGFAPEVAGATIALAVLNPPRAGCSAEVLAALVALAPRAIAYVSCNPAALERDLRQLAAHYEINAVAPFDMLPLTPHIEALAWLERRGTAAPPPRPV